MLIPVKLTGERPIEGQTPDSLLALHAAGYREVRDRMGPGRFLDLGCGLADGTATFAAPDRQLVGIDYDPATAAAARRSKIDTGLVTACSDGSALGLRGEMFDWVCSSHLIEHFVDPEPHVREVSRVLAAGNGVFHHSQRASRLRESLPRVPLRPGGAPVHAGASFRRGVRGWS